MPIKNRRAIHRTIASNLQRRARRTTGSITLMDVARIARVSPITASRALNTPDKVAAETLARVRDAVKQTGYVPNMLAGGLASSRSRLVAAVVPTIAGSVFLDMMQSLTDTLADAGYQLMLGQTGYEIAREDALIDAIIGRRPDGIVITGVMHSAYARKRLAASGIPVVETWDLTRSPIDMLVGFSHEKTGAAVARFLHDRDRRRPAIISGNDLRARRRVRAYLKAAQVLEGMEKPIVEWVQAPTTLKQGRDGMARILAKHPGIDSIFCSSDLLALGVLTEASARDIKVPGRIAVVGFGDLAFAAETHPPLTTVRIDGARIGQEAARFIVARAQGKPVADRILDIGFSIVERASA
jgi:LacI family transcriptional regulator, gluconate utilization system Gnt-I transcriptional repressor